MESEWCEVDGGTFVIRTRQEDYSIEGWLMFPEATIKRSRGLRVK